MRRAAFSAILLFIATAAIADPAHDLFTGQNTIVANGRLARFACHGCHGRDGRGGIEGNVPRIAGTDLQKPTGLRPAYDATTFAKALTEGVDPQGRSLSRIMPRYDLTPPETALLWQYLQDLPIRQTAGVTPTLIRLGVVIDPDFPGAGEHYLRGFNAELHRNPAARMLHGRRIEMIALTDPEQQADNVLAALAMPAGKSGLIKRLTATGLPVLFSLTALSGTEDRSIQRGLVPTQRDIYNAIARHLAATPARRIGIAASPDQTDALTRMIRLAIPDAEVAPVFADQGGLDAVIHLGGALPQDLRDPTILYRLASQPRGTDQLKRRFLVIDAPDLIALAVDENLHPLEAHATLAARILLKTIAKSGRDLTRSRLVSSLEKTDLGSEYLDYARLPLNGSDHVAIIADFRE